MRIMKNLKGEPYGGAWPIEDSNVLDCINNFLHGKKYIELNTINTQTYLERFFEFICGSNNDLHGIGDYTSKAFSLGTTNAFDSFFIKHSKKRLVSFSGEYVYHGIVQRTIDGSTNTLTDADQLKKGDALVISVPFADTGDEHEQLEDVLIACDNLSIPVLIDMAYINIAQGLSIDLTHKCIDSITSSLSKVFFIPECRAGIRLQKKNLDDNLDMMSENNYVNRMAVNLSIELFDNFDSNYITTKYKQQQVNFCEQLELQQSKTVIFGIDRNKKFKQYNRGTNTNRLCFSKHFTNGV